jgi:nucleoside-diphosphate-sugar epimerase
MEAAMFRRLLDRRPVLLPYHGLVVCSYGHVDDLCRALIVMAVHPAAVGAVFNVTTGAVTSAGYVATLAEVVGVPADVVPVPDHLLDAGDGPLFSRLFTPAHHGLLDAGKVTRILGVTPQYDLLAGHAHALEWFLRTGAADVDRALSDLLWGRTFDFDSEAAVAELARAALAGGTR